MKTQEIRNTFLNYFHKHQHLVLHSASLIPDDDPTLLFTNAGMVPFKKYFLGQSIPPAARITTVQKCVRAGGKHNDLENVGYTKRHHTFFEMLGNFSFSDYGKKEAITFAWIFLTEVLNLPPENLWITVYKKDKESERIWLKEIGINPQRFSRCAEKDNFWSMGDTGPCGPCTEIFYDHGESIPGGPPGSTEADGDRYVEIWNLVFMQFNRNLKGEFEPLPKLCVDTGMGLERIAAVMQGVTDNYETDTFQTLLRAIAAEATEYPTEHPSMRVIADHIRSSTFLITDGVMPANEGTGYVLRRIIRRAIRHGFKLGMNEAFFYKLVPVVIDIMASQYHDLSLSSALVQDLIKHEEEQFAHTLSKGIKIFEQMVSHLTSPIVPGEQVFQLYDTYGFPVDLTADMAREKSLTLDYEGFTRAMEQQRKRSQEKQVFKIDQTQTLYIEGKTHFVGYEKTSCEAQVIALIADQQPTSHLQTGQWGAVILDQTPFYSEAGGQVGDTGHLTGNNGTVFEVHDTQKQGDIVFHWGKVIAGELKQHPNVLATVNTARRLNIQCHHSATHLLHEALRRILGIHVKQRGSLVEPHRLRFDFSHPQALTEQEIYQVENWVNQEIRNDHPVVSQLSTLAEIKQSGTIALFDDKYGDSIRVIQMGHASTEACGGIHAEHTSQIGYFKIISEVGSSSGIRRIEAVVGEAFDQWLLRQEKNWLDISKRLKVQPEECLNKIDALMQQVKQLQKETLDLKQKCALAGTENNPIPTLELNDFHVWIRSLENAEMTGLRAEVDRLKSLHPRTIVLLSGIHEGKAIVVAGVSPTCSNQIQAKDILQQVIQLIDGRGGGRADFAQGGGPRVDLLPEAMETAFLFIKEQVAALG